MKKWITVFLVLVGTGLLLWWGVRISESSFVLIPLLAMLILGLAYGYFNFLDDYPIVRLLSFVVFFMMGIWVGDYSSNLLMLAPVIFITILGNIGGYALKNID